MPITLLRELNRSRVLNALLDGAAGTRTELAQQLGLSAMAVTRIVRELAEAGIVEETDRKPRQEVGRRPTELAIDPAGAYTIGFEVHAYQCSVVLLDLALRVVRRAAINLTAPTDVRRSLTEMADAAVSVIREAGVVPARVLGAGVAVMGIADRASGRLIDPSYLGWEPCDVATPLRTVLGMPVVVDRIPNALVAAEVRNAAGGLRNALLVNVGFVLSAAFLADGVLVRGDHGLAGQIGHIAVQGEQRQCACGQRGCLNVVASGWAALADIGILASPLSADALRSARPQLAELLDREAKRDPTASSAVQRAGRNLGRAMRGFRIALDPGRILLSGPLGRAQSFVAGVKSGIGDDAAGLVEPCDRNVDEAAALLAFDEFIRSPRLDFRRLRGAQSGAVARADAMVQSR